MPVEPPPPTGQPQARPQPGAVAKPVAAPQPGGATQADGTFLPTRTRRSLALKILVLLLGLATITLVASATISLYSLSSVRAAATASNEALGAHAVDNSSAALIAAAEENLQRRARAQAEISDSVFRRVECQTRQLALAATRIWGDPRFTVRRPEPPTDEPKDILSTSSYVAAPGVAHEAIVRDLDISAEMDPLFMALTTSDQVPLAVHVATTSGLLRTFPWRKGWAADFDPRTRDWFTQAVANKGIAWTKPYISKSTNRLIVTCSYPFYAADGGVQGVIKVDITPQTINDAIINLQVGQSGYAFLLDGEGLVIASPRMDDLDKMTMPVAQRPQSKLDTALRDPPSYKAVDLCYAIEPDLKAVAQRMVRKETGVARCSLGGNSHYLAFAPVPSTGWSIGLVLPVGEILAPAKSLASTLSLEAQRSTATIDKHVAQSITLLALLLTALLLAATWAALSMSRRITKPIRKLSAGTARLGSGDLDYQIIIRTGDEIELLANDFNAMTGNLKRYIADIGEATAARERVESELQVARKIQSSLLPRIFPAFPDRKEIDLFASMDAAREVGGDFYDFFLIDQDRLCLAIGDVSDKGVPASLFMAVTKTLIKTEALQPGRTAAEILERVNKQLCDENEMLMFVTVFCCIVNLRTGELEFANGGHNPPALWRAGGAAELMKPKKGIALAVMPEARFKVEHDVLRPGDTLFIYTDGVNEAMNLAREQFSYPRMLESLNARRTAAAKDITLALRADIQAFAGQAPQSDDITLITFRYLGPQA